MINLESLSQWASQLSLEDIKNLPEEEVLDRAMERPGHPGVYGFMLSPASFRSTEHCSEVFYALMKRLGEIENLKEKMK